MPLNFDPRAFVAPGGVASGIGDLGAAVVNALNRRAERRYQSEAAKAKAEAEESRFARQLQSQSDLQKMQNDAAFSRAQAGDTAAMERLKLSETGDTGRKLVGEVASTGRNFVSNATDILQTGMTTFGKLFSGGRTSSSKDGINQEKELNDTIIAINEQARKEYPDTKPDELARIADPEGYDAALSARQAQIAKNREAFKLKRGAEHGLTYQGGRFARAIAPDAAPPAPPAPAPKAPVAAAASTTSPLAAKYRAKFPTSPSSKLDDATLEKLLTERKWTGE